MAAAGSKIVQITRTFAASPELLCEAWLDPDLVQRWMFASPTNHIRAKTERRPGGAFSVTEWDGGEQIEHFGTYLEITDPRRVVFTLEVPKHFEGVSQVMVEIAPYAAGAAMMFVQTGVDKNVTEEHWRQMFVTLAAVLDELQ
jgi:uncharacterized protein YndB with AHSA1/START domain